MGFSSLNILNILSRVVEMMLVFAVNVNENILAVFEILTTVFYSEVC